MPADETLDLDDAFAKLDALVKDNDMTKPNVTFIKAALLSLKARHVELEARVKALEP